MRKGMRLRAVLLAGAISAGTFGVAHAQSTTPPEANPEAAEAATEALPAGSDGPRVGEILVTARRKTENVQRVPVAVTVLSPDAMRNTIVTDYASLIAQIPGYEALGGSHSAGSFSLSRVRGVTPVASYFADAPYPVRQFTYNAPFFDVGNVQFLKGPQGTLFGQASNAGAQLISPKRPGKEFGGYVKAEVGSLNLRSIEGAIDIPIAEGLQVRLSAVSRHRDSFVKDLLTKRPILNTDYDVERISIVAQPTDWIENYTVLQTEHVGDGFSVTNQVIGDYNFYDNPTNRRQAALNGMTLAQWNDARAQILARQIALGPYKRQGWSLGCPGTSLATATSSTVPGPNVDSVIPQPCGPGGGFVRIFSGVNTTTFTLSDALTLKNTVSHVWGRTRFGLQDIDGTRLIINDSNPKSALGVDRLPSSWSEELQLSGKFGDFDFVLGAFGYNEALHQSWPTFTTFTLSLAQSATLTRSISKSRSLYGQGNYDLSALIDGLKVTAGLRKTWDSSKQTIQNLNPNDLSVISTIGGPDSPAGFGKWDAISYTLSAQYQASPSTMVYLTNAKGYSGGGLQNVVGYERFDPDSLNNFEAGIKTTIRPSSDLVLTANLAAFYGFYNNVKVRQALLVPILNNPGQFSTALATTNAGKARIRGFELESSGSWGDWFEFNGSVAYNDPYYKTYPSLNAAGQPVDLSNTPFYTTPRWKLSFSPTFHLPVDKASIGDISIGALITRRTIMYANTAKPVTRTDPNNPDTGVICRVRRTTANGYPAIVADGKWAYKDCMPPNFNVNINVTWTDPMGYQGLRATLLINNVTKNKQPTGFDTQYDNVGAVGWEPNQPRGFALSLNYNF